MNKFKILLICFLLLVSCRSKKEVVDHRTEKQIDTVTVVNHIKDTVYKEVVIERTRPVYTETVIEKPCDSLGNLRPVNTVIGSGANKSSVISKDGKLYISQYLDSTTQAKELEMRSRFKQDSINTRKELVKELSKTTIKKVYVYPWWIYLVIAGGLFFFALWLWSRYSDLFFPILRMFRK